MEAQEFRITMRNYILILIVLFICSCSVKKNVLPGDIKKYSAKKVLRNANKTIKNFKNLQTKARVTVTNKGRDKSNNLNIRISKDKKLKGYVVKKRFYEIGSYSGIKQFKNFIKNELYKNLQK